MMAGNRDISLIEESRDFKWRKYNKKINKKIRDMFYTDILNKKYDNIFIYIQILNDNILNGKVYSQNDEDGIINTIFNIIGTTNKKYVEFGVEDGTECNTRFLRENKGWSGLLLDGGFENKKIGLYKEFITKENILDLFYKYKVKKDIDLLSIDIDGMDYHILKEILKIYKPRVFIVEYNCSYDDEKIMDYDSKYMWNKYKLYEGTSLKSFNNLSKEKGYILVLTNGVNAFFIRDDIYKKYKIFFPNASNYKKLMEKHPLVIDILSNRHYIDWREKKWKDKKGVVKK